MKQTRLVVPPGSSTHILEEYDDALPDTGGESEELPASVHGEPGGGDKLQQPATEAGGGVPSVQTEASGEPAKDQAPE